MCGLVAIHRYHPEASPASTEELQRSTAAMAARGPDAEGHWHSADGATLLGHRRLSIIDLSDDANQPLHSADGDLIIVFNGEIYNHNELRAHLSHGWSFQTSSDTEVILAAYAADPDGFVRSLRGMFAFAIWDRRRNELIAARDPYGIKPLYIADDGGVVRLASQVRALIAGGGISQELDAEAAYGFFCWGSVPEPRTLYRGIRAVPPGHVLRVRQAAAVQMERFANIESLFMETGAASPADVPGVIASALRETTEYHMVADVQVGVFLSGGIDSTMLASQVAEVSSRPPVAVTLGFREFEGTERDETRLAAQVARELKLDHHIYWLDADEFLADLDNAMLAMDQPSIDGINIYFVSKAARSAGLKTVLSGLGGDELFGGYRSFSALPRWLNWRRAIPSVPGLPDAVRAAISVARRVEPVRRRLPAKLAGVLDAEPTLAGMYGLRRGLFLPEEATALVRAYLGTRESCEAAPMTLQAWQPPPDTVPNYRSIAAMESTLYMRNQLLRDSDWASMAHGLELRVPLVDYQLAAQMIPVLAGLSRVDKSYLRGRARYQFQDRVYQRAKTGFHTPVDRWILRAGILSGSDSEGRPARDWAKYVFQRFIDHDGVSGLN